MSALPTSSANPARVAARDSATRIWAWPAAAGPALALAAMVHAHLTPGVGVSPLRGLISDYALNDATRGAILLGTLALAMSCLWSTYGLAQIAPARSAATRVLLTFGALGLVLAAIFPTDPTPGVTSMGGEIHRWSAAVVFTGLPCAAWMLARGDDGLRRLRVAAVWSTGLLVAFLSAHPGSFVSDLVNGSAYYGLLQRLLLISGMVILFLVATAIPRLTDTRSPSLP
ncbi:DUF998 domain-containing protein [Spongiactinospora sp. TRM90649]|uniref:DUF998 domain-containing protein n=1 Tax=Spongiactinospora sp. TRM90649 TaxID=3031114 RepID=UPI0023F8A82E|nr:DUF998 domain-containing protein [Spongiactinospora sp. TRM90649]MDF5752755.1 DUF998 domain-containing protein [Spongiactinospora sp. TRM90649]